MAGIEDFLDLAAISGETVAGDTDIVPDINPPPFTLPPDLMAPLRTPDPAVEGPRIPGTVGQPTPTPQGTVDPQVRMAANILALLMAGGGLAGIGQELFGGGGEKVVTPRLLPEARQAFGASQEQFGQTSSILQQLLGVLQNPQIPPGLSLLAEQSFQPQLGNLYQQAVEAGRRRGFHDPGISPPGGAILGPGLADLQGQIAQAKLNLYQNNIANTLQALQGSRLLAQGQGQIATGFPAGRRTDEPNASILDTLGKASPIVGGIGSLLAAVNPPPPPTVPPALSRLFASLSGAA